MEQVGQKLSDLNTARIVSGWRRDSNFRCNLACGGATGPPTVVTANAELGMDQHGQKLQI